MPGDEPFRTLDFTPSFLDDLTNATEFNRSERRAFLKALRLLDENEKHRSLRVHDLKSDLEGVWSASASESLRMTFIRGGGGRKVMLTCSHHYG